MRQEKSRSAARRRSTPSKPKSNRKPHGVSVSIATEPSVACAPRPVISAEERHLRIARVAYGLAEATQFQGRDALADWLRAEHLVG